MDLNNLSSDILYPGQTVKVLSPQVDLDSPRKSLTISPSSLLFKETAEGEKINLKEIFVMRNGVTALLCSLLNIDTHLYYFHDK
jgi:hypothetical protein